MFGAIKGVVSGLIKPVTSLVEGWQQRKKAKLQNKLALEKAETEAKINYVKTAQQGKLAWEKEALKQSGWKDEYWTLVLSIPAILCFIPGMAGHVMEGFAALQETPDWYQWAICVAIAASFGYRKLADVMSLKNGG